MSAHFICMCARWSMPEGRVCGHEEGGVVWGQHMTPHNRFSESRANEPTDDMLQKDMVTEGQEPANCHS